MSEDVEDEEIDIESTTKVIFTKSEFATQKWDGFVFEVVSDNGDKVLDPEAITYQ